MNVAVREARPGDHAAWLKLWQGYNDFYGSNLEDGVTAFTWKRILSPDAPLICRVAEVGDAVIGFALCVMHEGTWVTKPVCYLEDLYVDESMRGRGAGKALIEALRDEGQQQGWAKIYWVTREHNPARKLYDRLAVVDDFVRYTMKL